MGKSLFSDLSGLSKTINDSIDAQKAASDEYQKSLISHLGSIEYQLNNISVLLKSIDRRLYYRLYDSDDPNNTFDISELVHDIYSK